MKVNPQKKIQKRRTEDELRNALASYPGDGYPVDIDDPRVAINDMIEELLELRSLREEVASFAQSIKNKLAVRS